MKRNLQNRFGIIGLLFCLLLMSTSFQPGGKNALLIKNVGVARDQPTEIRFNFNKNDRLHLTFRDVNNNVYLDKDIDYSLRKLPGKTLGSGHIAGSFKMIEIEEGGEYFLELKKSSKRVAFINIEIDKTTGSWTEGSLPPLTIQSALMPPPSKGGKPGGISVVFPTKKGQKVVMGGTGKEASAISLYVPNYEINTSLDKGINQEISQDMPFEILVFLDEANLKSKGLIDKVSGWFKKSGAVNLNQFSDLKAQISKKADQGASGANPLASKPTGNEGTKSAADEGGGELTMKEIMQQNKERQEQDAARQAEALQSVTDVLNKMSASDKARLVSLDMFSKMMNLPNKYDFSVDKKRECTKIIGFKPDVEFYIAYWVGINAEIHQRYLRELGRMRADPNILSTPLNEYGNYLYFQKGYRELAANVPMRFPLANLGGASVDDIEIALLDKNNSALFLVGQPYNSFAAGMVGSSGQMFGMVPASLTSELFICACNHNKLSPVKLFVYTESFGLPEIQ